MVFLMWFEILPAFAVIVGTVAAPHYLAYAMNYFVNSNCYRRMMETREQRLQYLRDTRLTGDPYKVAGLEKISEECPDEESTTDECYEILDEEECDEEDK
ncbi:uncharacterized protein isoform X2 [Leptinotarsa decemlineata]|uniref:uncharacterized protein isoform X2 n=1 Tax=Leptinotarsa decemlineata TaxID=7539 RepID=UPI003D30A855